LSWESWKNKTWMKMELVDKTRIQKSQTLNDKWIKEVEIFVYAMAQPTLEEPH